MTLPPSHYDEPLGPVPPTAFAGSPDVWEPDERRAIEYVSRTGYRGSEILRVPLAHAGDRPPEREGWEPFFVSVNLRSPTQKVVSYKREEPRGAD